MKSQVSQISGPPRGFFIRRQQALIVLDGRIEIPPHAVHLCPRQRDEDGRQYQGEIVERLLLSLLFRRFSFKGCFQKVSAAAEKPPQSGFCSSSKVIASRRRRTFAHSDGKLSSRRTAR